MNNSKIEQSTFVNSYGVIRITACIMVILHHLIGATYGYEVSELNKKFLIVIDNLCMVNNGLFFMLSGKFALEKVYPSVNDYYFKRFKKVVLPFLFVALIQYGITNVNSFSLVGFLKLIRGGEITDWFVYAVVGFYLVAPFFSKLMHYLSEKEKIYFFILIIVSIAINTNNSISPFVVFMNGNPFTENLAFFFIGYLIDHIEHFKKKESTFVIMGIIFAFVSTLEILINPTWNPLKYGGCISRVFMCIGYFVFVECIFNKSNKMRLVKTISGLTYYIYLLHGLMQGIVLKLFNLDVMNFAAKYIVYTILVFSFSFFGALIMKVLFKYTNRGVEKLIVLCH